MTEFLRELLYPSSAASIGLDELYVRLRLFMFVPLPTVQTTPEPNVVIAPVEPVIPITPNKVAVDPLPPINVSVPPIVPPHPRISKGFTSILWCAYTIAHGCRELNIPLALLAREERKIREDCINSVSPGAVKQRFGFLTLSQIQTLLQEIQQTKSRSESPATWYIWSVYYATTMPTVHLVYGRVCIHLLAPSAEAPTVQILYDKPQGVMRVVEDIDVSDLVQITNLLKPMNGIGSYTLLELKQMSTQLELPVAPTAKKTALYESIVEYVRTTIV